MSDLLEGLNAIFAEQEVERDETGAFRLLRKWLAPLDPTTLFFADRYGRISDLDNKDESGPIHDVPSIAATLAKSMGDDGFVTQTGTTNEGRPWTALAARIENTLVGGEFLGVIVRELPAGFCPGDSWCSEIKILASVVWIAVTTTVELRLANTHVRHLQAEQEVIRQAHGDVVASVLQEREDRLREKRDHILHLEEQVNERSGALRASEERLRKLIENLPIGLARISPRSDRFIMVNPAAVRMFGYDSAEELMEVRVTDLYADPSDRNIVPMKLSSEEKIVACEIPLKKKDGSVWWGSMSARSVRDSSGRVEYFDGVVEDITERKRAEMKLLETNRQLEDATARANDMARHAELASASKSEFLANMSHEIRTPMTAILGYADVLLEKDNIERAPPAHSEAVKMIRRNGQHLLAIINDILDISKIEAGRLQVEHVPCSPPQTIAEVMSLMRARATAKNLSMVCEYVGPIPGSFQTDPLRLRQILVNLVGNAIKFTDTGGVRIITRLVPGDTSMIQFDILDTGIGMIPEEAARLFQPFTQVDGSTARKFGGTGLGLTISKRLAQMLGGDVCIVQTQPGVGTQLRVTLPRGPLDNVKMLEDPMASTLWGVEERPETVEHDDKLNCRILLAEDGPDNQRLIAHVLHKAGAEVTTVENGQFAVDAALRARDAGTPFDVILMDMQMPVMDGYEATALLRKRGYTWPIIALTAHAMASDRQKSIDAGCDDHATKPIDRRTLIETIRSRTKRAPAELVHLHDQVRELADLCEEAREGAAVEPAPEAAGDSTHKVVP